MLSKYYHQRRNPIFSLSFPSISSCCILLAGTLLSCVPTLQASLVADTKVPGWKLPPPTLRSAATSPLGVTATTILALLQLSSSTVLSTMQWLPTLARVTSTGAPLTSSLVWAPGSSLSSISGSPPPC